jgi:hypothetical protein
LVEGWWPKSPIRRSISAADRFIGHRRDMSVVEDLSRGCRVQWRCKGRCNVAAPESDGVGFPVEAAVAEAECAAGGDPWPWWMVCACVVEATGVEIVSADGDLLLFSVTVTVAGVRGQCA